MMTQIGAATLLILRLLRCDTKVGSIDCLDLRLVELLDAERFVNLGYGALRRLFYVAPRPITSRNGNVPSAFRRFGRQGQIYNGSHLALRLLHNLVRLHVCERAAHELLL
jgi:hypothetical protein